MSGCPGVRGLGSGAEGVGDILRTPGTPCHCIPAYSLNENLLAAGRSTAHFPVFKLESGSPENPLQSFQSSPDTLDGKAATQSRQNSSTANSLWAYGRMGFP